jgi:hypothetical protein
MGVLRHSEVPSAPATGFEVCSVAITLISDEIPYRPRFPT